MFFGFSEVMDHWYLARMADIIRRMSMPAFFVRKGGSDAEYIAYFCLSRTWKEQYKAAFTQLMDPGQEVEITFWPPGHTFHGHRKGVLDKKTTLTWVGQVIEPDRGSGGTPPAHPFNLRIVVRRADPGEVRWKNTPLPGAVPELCEMNVHAMDAIGDPNHVGKNVFLKLKPTSIVTKKRLAAIIRMYDKEPGENEKKRWAVERPAVYEDDAADWSTDWGSDNNQLADDLEKDKEVLDYPFVRKWRPNCSWSLERHTSGSSRMREVLCGRRLSEPQKTFDFWHGLDTKERKTFLSLMLPDISSRFANYSRRVYGGVLLVAGAPGTGKTTFIAQLVAGRVSARKTVSCFAPTNAAATVFFTRFMSIIKQIDCHDHFLAIRAFGTHIEVHVIMNFIQNGHGQHEWDNHPFYNEQHSSGPLANAEWRKEGSMAAVILGLIGLIQCDNQVLLRMRASPNISELVQVIFDGTNASGPGQEDGGSACRGPPGGVFTAPNSGTPWIPSNQSPRSAARQLIRQILWRASAVFTTTHVAADKIIKPFTKTAEEYAGDEMGCTTVPEVLMVWRQGRPIIFAGDVWQLLPATLSSGEKFPNGVSVNPLYLQHRRSAMRHLMSMGWPVMVLREQIRMCPGLMDLSMKLFYKDWQLVYASQNNIDAHSLGIACEGWARRDLKLHGSPTGKVLPVFIHASNTTVNFTDISMSRDNPRMLDITIILVKRLIENVKIQPRDLAIVTPYKAQLLKLKERLGRHGALVDKPDQVQITTADRVQGAERKIILFLMVNTAKTGAGFLFDPNRLNVISTRATDFFIIIGDRQVATKAPGRNQVDVDARPLREWIEWFHRNQRVVDASTVEFITNGDAKAFP